MIGKGHNACPDSTIKSGHTGGYESGIPNCSEHVVFGGTDNNNITFIGYNGSEMDQGVYYEFLINDGFRIEIDLSADSWIGHAAPEAFYIKLGNLTGKIEATGSTFSVGDNVLVSTSDTRYHLIMYLNYQGADTRGPNVDYTGKYAVYLSPYGTAEGGTEYTADLDISGRTQVSYSATHGSHGCSAYTKISITGIIMKQKQPEITSSSCRKKEEAPEGTGYTSDKDKTTPPSETTEEPKTEVATCADLGIPSMQNWKGTLSSVGESATLCDDRDLSTYDVKLYPDGKIWTDRNLRLDFSNLKQNISASNTNNPTPTFISAANARPGSETTWCDTLDASCINKIYYNTDNIGDMGPIHALEPRNIDANGVYYNYYTATAGNKTYDGDLFSKGTVSGDLCPSGWRLPTADEFKNISNILLYDDIVRGEERGTPYGTCPHVFIDYHDWLQYFGLSGLYEKSFGVWNRTIGSSGVYWSSTYDGTDSYTLENNLEFVCAGNSYQRLYNGAAIRCVRNAPAAPVSKGSYPVIFHINDGTTKNNVQVIDVDKSVALNKNTFTRTGYIFQGWNTKPDGTGTSYSDGQTVLNLSSRDVPFQLYAMWEEEPTAFEPGAIVSFDGYGFTFSFSDNLKLASKEDVMAGTCYSQLNTSFMTYPQVYDYPSGAGREWTGSVGPYQDNSGLWNCSAWTLYNPVYHPSEFIIYTQSYGSNSDISNDILRVHNCVANIGSIYSCMDEGNTFNRSNILFELYASTSRTSPAGNRYWVAAKATKVSSDSFYFTIINEFTNRDPSSYL